MKYLRDCDPRFQHLGLKVGSFLALLVVLLLVMAALLGWRQDLFESAVYYECSPPRADAIFPGMDVTLRGIRVGRVTRVGFDDGGAPQVRLRVRESATDWLHGDASVVLSGVDFLGTPFLDLRPGSPRSGPLAPGSDLPFERELSFGEVAVKLEEQLRPVIAEVAELIQSLNMPEGDVRQSLANLRTLSESLASELPPTLADARSSAAAARVFIEEVAAEGGDFDTVRTNLAAVSTEIESRLPKLVDQAEASLTALKNTTAELERATRSSTPEIRKLIDRSNEAAQDAGGLISDVRRVWFMKLLLPRKPSTPPDESR